MKVATSTCDWAFARPSALADSTRSAAPRLNAFACSPFQRLAWYPLQAVATVASASSTVAMASNRSIWPLELTGRPRSRSGRRRARQTASGRTHRRRRPPSRLRARAWNLGARGTTSRGALGGREVLDPRPARDFALRRAARAVSFGRDAHSVLLSVDAARPGRLRERRDRDDRPPPRNARHPGVVKT